MMLVWRLIVKEEAVYQSLQHNQIVSEYSHDSNYMFSQMLKVVVKSGVCSYKINVQNKMMDSLHIRINGQVLSKKRDILWLDK